MKGWVAAGVILLAITCLIDLPRARKPNTTLHGYFLLNGRLKLPGFLATILSANLSIGNFIVFVASWGYLFGWGGIFWFTINLALNVIGYFIFLPAFKGYIEDPKNSGTIHEFLATTFADEGNIYRLKIRLLASATTIIGLLFAIVFELHLGAILIASLLEISPVVIFSCLTVLICLYSGVGGFHTLVFTDILQSIAIIIGSAIIVPLLYGMSEASSLAAKIYPFTLKTLDIGILNILVICLVGSGWFLVAMDQWQRSCATRSAARTQKGMILYFIIIAIFGAIYAFVGMFDRLVIETQLPASLAQQFSKGANPLSDFFLYASISPETSRIVFASFAVALLAAAMSTANTFLIVSGHSFVSDLLLAVKKNTSIHNLSTQEESGFLTIARGTITGMALFVIITWLILVYFGLLTDPLSFFFIAYSIQFALLASMIFTRLPKRFFPNEKAVFKSILLGVIAALIAGFGLWYLIQLGDPVLLFGFKASEWVALTPFITTVIGILPLVFSKRRTT